MTQRRFFKLGLSIVLPLLGLLVLTQPLVWAQEGEEANPQAIPTPDPNSVGANNKLFNGNFEFGFYGTPIGAVPNNWDWFINEQAAGKFGIYDDAGYGIVCPDDAIRTSVGKRSLILSIFSSDQNDTRVGVHQTVVVEPGQAYLFAMSGTVQIQKGIFGPEKYNRVELAFDDNGNQDWQAIPATDWIRMPWQEYLLEYRTTGDNDPDRPTIESYYTVVRPTSNQLTIFISARRDYPAWAATRFTIDCASLVPLNTLPQTELLNVAASSASAVDIALGGELPTELVDGPLAQSANPTPAPTAVLETIAKPPELMSQAELAAFGLTANHPALAHVQATAQTVAQTATHTTTASDTVASSILTGATVISASGEPVDEILPDSGGQRSALPRETLLLGVLVTALLLLGGVWQVGRS